MKIQRFLGIMPLLFCAVLLSTGCEKDQPCTDILCANGGTCVNGSCDCPDGYTGPDCSDEEEPQAVIIESITVKGFPATAPGGGGWDLLDGADLMIFIEDQNGNEVWNPNTFYEDADPNGSYSWEPGLRITDVRGRHSLFVLDYDDGLSANDLIGGANFTPYNPGSNFPTQIGGEVEGVSLDIRVRYEF